MEGSGPPLITRLINFSTVERSGLIILGFKKAGRLENYTVFVDEMLAKMDTTLQGMKDTACLAEFKSHLSKAKVALRLQEVLARSWSLHAIISAKRHLEENAAQAGIQQQMQEKRIQHKEKDNLVVDEILARVNEPQGTLSQMLHAYNKKSELESITIDTESIKKKRDEREHCSKTDATKRGVETATHRTPQKETAKRRKNLGAKLCHNGEGCTRRNCVFGHPNGQKILFRDSKKNKDDQLATRGHSARGRSPAVWEGKEGGLQHSLRFQNDKARRHQSQSPPSYQSRSQMERERPQHPRESERSNFR